MPRTFAAAMYSEVSQNWVVGARVATYNSSVPSTTNAAIRYGGRSGAATSTGDAGFGVGRFGDATARSVMVARLVSELPHTREHHRQPALVRRGDHLGVAHRDARLNDRRDARLRGLVHAVAEREERVARQHRTRGIDAVLAGLVDGEERRVHARHLPRADPDRRLALGEQDRVRLDRRHRRPREPQIAPFYPGRFPFGHDLPPRLRGLAARVEAVLHQKAAADALEVP